MKKGLIGLMMVFPVLAACTTVPMAVPPSLSEARAALESAKQAKADVLAPEDYKAAVRQLAKAESAFTSEQSAVVVEDLAFQARAEAEVAQINARRRITEKEYEGIQQALTEQQTRQAQLLQRKQAWETAKSALPNASRKSYGKEKLPRPLRQDGEREATLLRRVQGIANARVKREERGLVIRFADPMLFDAGSSKLQSEAPTALDPLAAALKDYPDTLVHIESHTDNTGDALANNTLSQARAESVLAYLNQKGVGLDNLTAMGLGSGRPIADNSSPSGRETNRRLEIILEQKGSKNTKP